MMAVPKRRAGKLQVHPLTPERWGDLEKLFGPRGACAGCWCMYWRLPRSEFNAGKGDGNREAFRRLVASGRVPGILAYDGDEPVGWCAVEPRQQYPGLGRSRVLRPVDDTPVWSVTCLFVRRDHRRTGVSVELLRGAVGHVRRQGGRVVEGYPVEPASGQTADAFAYTGLVSAFRRAGFTEVARGSPVRPIMRRKVARGPKA
jgi:GNAT superfamily N-acetyltransferase